ncbi:MAG: hypothetical protein ACI84R_003598 [Candidatus Azotimanducaceae bacterium]|jgi:hypothetical protein
MADLEQKATRIAKVRRREELRLIKIAGKVGLFKQRVSSAQLEELLRSGLTELGELKISQLLRLEEDMAKAMSAKNDEARREDTRRKILLGSFLIAQMEHKPVLRADMVAELDQFLELHKDPNAVVRNKELLKEWLVPVSPEQKAGAASVTA